MKENYTHISFVIDRSGSMQSILLDTIGGFNGFLNEQKAIGLECTFTFCQFDNEYEVVHNFIDIKDVPELTRETFRPRGSTAMLDAIGRQIVDTGEKLVALEEDQRPDKVLFVILTDGQENVSREYTYTRIKEMITHQTEAYGWAFMFLGANIDAVSVGATLGIDRDFTATYTAGTIGVGSTFSSLSEKTSGLRSSVGPLYRMGVKSAAAQAFSYTDEERTILVQ